MKLKIVENSNLDEDIVIIECKKITDDVDTKKIDTQKTFIVTDKKRVSNIRIVSNNRIKTKPTKKPKPYICKFDKYGDNAFLSISLSSLIASIISPIIY